MKSHAQLLDWLIVRKAQLIKHSGRTLYEHLVGVYNILKAAGQRDIVCNAGLFHSIYGTEFFKTEVVVPDDRSTLHDLIGAEAENLVWHFCTLNRSKTFTSYQDYVRQQESLGERTSDDERLSYQLFFREGVLGDGVCVRSPVNEDAQWLVDLMTVEAANLLEQKILWKSTYLSDHAIESGILTKAGSSIMRPLKTYYETYMLKSAKQSLLVALTQKINRRREASSDNGLGGMGLKALKATQARYVMEQSNSSNIYDMENIELLKNYAQANQLSLIEAAQIILKKESDAAFILIDSELKKDQLAADVRRAVGFSDLEIIRFKISELFN